jgi:hypothetical protein
MTLGHASHVPRWEARARARRRVAPPNIVNNIAVGKDTAAGRDR